MKWNLFSFNCMREKRQIFSNFGHWGAAAAFDPDPPWNCQRCASRSDPDSGLFGTFPGECFKITRDGGDNVSTFSVPVEDENR